MKRKILKSIVGFSLPAWVNALIGFLVIPIFTRMFAPEELGKFNLFCAYGNLLYYMALLGINQGYMRFYNEVPGRNSQDGLFRLSVRIVLISALFFDAIIMLAWKPLSNAITGAYGFGIPICLAMMVSANVFIAMKNSEYRMKNDLMRYCTLAISANICAKVSYLGAIAVDGSAMTAIIIFSSSVCILALIYALLSAIKMGGVKVYCGREELLPLLIFSVPLLPVLLFSQLNAALPKLLMEKYLSYADIGLYSAAYSVVSVVSLVQAGINIFWAPFVYDNYRENGHLLTRAHELVTFTMIAFGMAVLLFQDILYLIIGSAYRSSQNFFALLLVSPIYYTIAETTGIGINIAKKSYLNLITYSVAGLTTLIFSALLMPLIGLYGAAISVAVSALSMLVIRTIIGERYYSVVRSYKKTFTAPIAFIAVAAFNSVFCNHIMLRCSINFAIIVLLCVAYRSELKDLYKFTLSILKTKNS